MRDRKMTVLLIEDDPDDALLMANMMGRSDWPSFLFTLECAEDLKSGLAILERGETEAVLLDLMLPDSQGLETLQQLRARFPNVPVVVLTGLLDEALGLESVMRGAQDYQIKGEIDGRALKRTISYAVERHRMLTRFMRLIEGAADGMVVIDGKGAIRYLNPAAEALFGWKAARMIGRPFPHDLSPRSGGELKIPFEGASERIAELRVAEIDWEDEPAKLATLRDITELRRVEQLKAAVSESLRLDKLKDELVSTVSHAMRSALSIVKAACENMKDGFAGALSERQSGLMSLQHRNILRLEKVVERILDLSRLESGKTRIRAERVDAAALIDETAKDYRLLSAQRRLEIVQEVPPGLPAAHADPELFVEALGNLIDNGLRYARSRILIRAAAEDEDGGDGPRRFLRITVSDDGPGIPETIVGDLFDKFVQVRRAAKSSGYKGTGLGLAISKEMVERQGGRIWAESRYGHGISFHMLLPRHDAESVETGGRVYAKEP